MCTFASSEPDEPVVRQANLDVYPKNHTAENSCHLMGELLNAPFCLKAPPIQGQNYLYTIIFGLCHVNP